MAIWGRLSDFSLYVVLTGLGNHRSGVIHIDIGDGNQYYLHISAQALTALQINTADFTHLWQARSVLARLLRATNGTFRYLSAEASPLRRDFHLNLEKLANISNVPAYADNPLREPRLLSVFQNRGIKKCYRMSMRVLFCATYVYTLGNYVLRQFLERAAWQLGAGVSAAELARLLSEDIEKIQFYFYRLIELGVIIPVE